MLGAARRRCDPTGLVGPFFHATKTRNASSILKSGFDLDRFGERTSVGKATAFGIPLKPIFGLGVYLGHSREVAERYGAAVLAVWLHGGVRLFKSDFENVVNGNREPYWWPDFLAWVAKGGVAADGRVYFQPDYYRSRVQGKYGPNPTAADMREYFESYGTGQPWLPDVPRWDKGHAIDEFVKLTIIYADYRVGAQVIDWDSELTIIDTDAVACVERV